MHGVNLHLLIRVHLGKAPHVLEASQIRFEEMTLAGDEVCRGLGGGGGGVSGGGGGGVGGGGDGEPVGGQKVVDSPPFEADHTSAHLFHLLPAHPLSEQQESGK